MVQLELYGQRRSQKLVASSAHLSQLHSQAALYSDRLLVVLHVQLAGMLLALQAAEPQRCTSSNTQITRTGTRSKAKQA